MNKAMKDNKEYECLRSWVAKVRDRLTDPRQGGGSPDLSEDGQTWRYSFMPKGTMSMEVEELQLLLRYFNLPALKPIKSGGNCQDCLHGKGVSSMTGMWPVIHDCEGCYGPTHPYFIPHEAFLNFGFIKKSQVYRVPCGNHIEYTIAALDPDEWKYYEVGGFCYRLKDRQRICKMESLGKLDMPGNKRGGY